VDPGQADVDVDGWARSTGPGATFHDFCSLFLSVLGRTQTNHFGPCGGSLPRCCGWGHFANACF